MYNATGILSFTATSSQCVHSPELCYLSITSQGQARWPASSSTADHSETPTGTPAHIFSFLLGSGDSTGLENKYDITYHVRHIMNDTVSQLSTSGTRNSALYHHEISETHFLIIGTVLTHTCTTSTFS